MTDAPSGTEPSAPSELTALEQPRRLSQSCLWTVQRDYYEQKGVAAWGVGATPHEISTNPRMAGAYADLLAGWLDDLRGAPETSESPEGPVILELGAGSGRFAHHCIRRLLDVLEAGHSDAAAAGFTYVMTDMSEANIRWWQAHPKLRPLVERGLLDFALFDATTPGPVKLRASGRVLDVGSAAGVAVVANYLFDSIPQDSFALHGGVLYENLVAASVRGGPPSGPVAADELVLQGSPRPLVLADYAEEPGVTELLQEYQRDLDDTCFTLPTVGFGCLDWLARLGGGRLLLLAGDKGRVELDSLRNRPPPPIAAQGGSFSLPVNLHAMGRWMENQGGALLATPERRVHFEIVAGLLGEPDETWQALRRAFEESISRHNPVDFFELRQWSCAEAEGKPASFALSLLRQSDWDAAVFDAVIEDLVEQVPQSPAGLRREVQRAVTQVWKTTFPTPEATDTAFDVARVFIALGRYDLARAAFMDSLRFAGPDPATFVNVGVCCLELGELEAARRCVQEALARDPGSEAARRLARAIPKGV